MDTEQLRELMHSRGIHCNAAVPMPEGEFAALTLDGFRAMPDAQQVATLNRMDKAQFARWLARAVPVKGKDDAGSLTAEIYRRRSA